MELSCPRTNAVPSFSKPWYHTLISHRIHILLVDHDKECLNSTSKMLELCAYKVTKVENASTALNMLQAGKKQFEVVIANIHSPDLHAAYHLFQEAVKMDLLVILMSAYEETLVANRAIENGAFLYVQKPINLDLVKHLWQHVMRERCRKSKEKDTLGERHIGGENDEACRKVTGKRKERSGKASMEDQMNQATARDGSFGRRKVCTEWTKELHAKFMAVVNQLGEGRCYPKDILERMNVPGLTRMQVASHLQKCRHDNWRSPEDRRYQPRTSPDSPKNDESEERDNVRRFGSMPRSCNASHQPENQENSVTSQINLASANINNNSTNERGKISRQVEASQNIGHGNMEMLNEENKSYFVFPIDKSHGNGNGNGNGNEILIPTGIPTTTNALYMTSDDIFGPKFLAFGSASTLRNQRRPSEDFLELTEDMDFLVIDPQELEQGSGSNDGQSQQMACFDQVDPEKQFPEGSNMGTGCQDGSETTNSDSTSGNAP